MILTVTLNPSVDISYRLDKFEINKTNRSTNVIKTAGGKGINVSRVLKQLGNDVVATGFLGGNLGEFIKKELDKAGIIHDFLFTSKETRNCIAILDKDNQTEILESGEKLDENDLDYFLRKYSLLCSQMEIVSISGSAPLGVDSDYIQKLIQIAKDNNCKVIVDMSGKILNDIITKFEYKPYAIKPNLEEFKDFIGKEEIDIKYELLNSTKGIEFVMLTCGKQGSYVKYIDKVYKVDIPKVYAINPVGSGDSTVAGLIYAIDKDMYIEDAIKISNACGISNCMSEMTGNIDINQVKELKKQINIKEL